MIISNKVATLPDKCVHGASNLRQELVKAKLTA